jgi:hypothetical protein
MQQWQVFDFNGWTTRRHFVRGMTLLKRRAGTSPAVRLLLALLLITGCLDMTATELAGTSDLTGGSLLISGVMTPQHQGVRLVQGGTPVTDAEVTVNGIRIPHCCGDLYSGDLPEAVPAGATLNLKVVGAGVTFEAQGDVIAPPTITAPVAGSTFAWTDAISLAWSTPADPDRFEVCLNCWPNSNDGEIYPALGSARQFNIAPRSLVDYGEGTVVAVYAFKKKFLKLASTGKINLDVLFVARSRDALIKIKY